VGVIYGIFSQLQGDRGGFYGDSSNFFGF